MGCKLLPMARITFVTATIKALPGDFGLYSLVCYDSAGGVSYKATLDAEGYHDWVMKYYPAKLSILK